MSQASSAKSPDTHKNEISSIYHESEIDIVTAAEHLRFAADMLAKITGKGESGDVEDVLGVVFEK
jgi:tRNA U34 5-carboxymethylaminomethyl modifying GTPase MnmE/TrmE